MVSGVMPRFFCMNDSFSQPEYWNDLGFVYAPPASDLCIPLLLPPPASWALWPAVESGVG